MIITCKCYTKKQDGKIVNTFAPSTGPGFSPKEQDYSVQLTGKISRRTGNFVVLLFKIL